LQYPDLPIAKEQNPLWSRPGIRKPGAEPGTGRGWFLASGAKEDWRILHKL